MNGSHFIRLANMERLKPAIPKKTMKLIIKQMAAEMILERYHSKGRSGFNNRWAPAAIEAIQVAAEPMLIEMFADLRVFAILSSRKTVDDKMVWAWKLLKHRQPFDDGLIRLLQQMRRR